MRGPVYGFEIILDAVPEPRAHGARPALEASDLMPIKRDFAFVIDDSVAAEKLVKAARGADRGLISDVAVFDVFAGGAIGAGKKSVAIEITISPRERSLTEQEIEAISARSLPRPARRPAQRCGRDEPRLKFEIPAFCNHGLPLADQFFHRHCR